jgi:aspartokinase
VPEEARIVARSEKIAVGGMLQTRGLVLIQVLGARKGPGVAGRTLSTLGRNGINVIGVASFADIHELGNICFAINKDDLDQALGLLHMISTSISTVSCVIDEEQLQAAVEKLKDYFLVP